MSFKCAVKHIRCCFVESDADLVQFVSLRHHISGKASHESQ
jgi:hypothetical protein